MNKTNLKKKNQSALNFETSVLYTMCPGSTFDSRGLDRYGHYSYTIIYMNH